MRSDVKREFVAAQDSLLEQVRSITRILERDDFTAIGRRELLSSLDMVKERLARLPFRTPPLKKEDA